MGLQQPAGQRRGQRQGVQARDRHRDGDGDRELLVELAGDAVEECHGHEHRAQHQGDGDDRARHLPHGQVRRFQWLRAGLDVALHVLHHHDGVVHHDTDSQYQPEQAQGIQREIGRASCRERVCLYV